LNYTGVLIHIGNNKDNTMGCPLTGTYFNKVLNTVRSTAAFEKLYKKVIESAKAGLFVVIIKDEI